MGDLILHHEISGASNWRSQSIVRRQNRGLPNYARRIYSAEILGLQSPMTARVIEGPGAEEEWKKEITLYSSLRNPYVLQLYGIGHSGGVHVLVFHDNLVPWRKFQDQYADQPHFSQVYFYACLDTQLRGGRQYISSICGGQLSWNKYTVWIQPFKGVLHMELKPPESGATLLRRIPDDHGPSSISSFLTPPPTSMSIDSLSLDCHLSICSWYLSSFDWSTVPTNLPVHLGSIYHVPTTGSPLDLAFQMAFFPEVQPISSGWCEEDPNVNRIKEDKDKDISILENGWIRVNSSGVWNRYCHETHISWSRARRGWLAQATHIFGVLDISSNLHQYVICDRLRCFVNLGDSMENLPTGYLFLCPTEGFTVDERGHYTIPDCPAYWSLDPSGGVRLTAEEANTLGFPELHLELKVHGTLWRDDDYIGIRQFHAVKGYDPDGLDVARELGYPIFELTCTKEELHAHLRALRIKEDSKEDRFGDAAENEVEEGTLPWSRSRMMKSWRFKMRSFQDQSTRTEKTSRQRKGFWWALFKSKSR
ncbi:hypothetical protein FB45DRAFT_923951 [Roridomyces roridus]|uniref:Protein kinase domain-containing protein n=1 Tax=Roridomyces roridus TaxID=1738132 RepID=A0AAD7BM42_9AGAR|nr:hypothetical protein FB45DRAFT_923951 [Roridomyces roridus]